MLTCFRCAKIIKGEVLHHVPPLYLSQLGLDFHRAYHPGCYKAEEVEAATELQASCNDESREA